jgi:hypothetical protein
MKSSLVRMLGPILLLSATSIALANHADGHWNHHDRGNPVVAPRQHADAVAHFEHHRYFPPVGAAFRTLPRSYYSIPFHGAHYYCHDGIWYRHGATGFVVVRPPVGVYVDFLPPFYSTLWFGGVRYYFANDIYYRWDLAQRAYVVSEPPTEQTQDKMPAENDSDHLFAYPRNGQTDEQKTVDVNECKQWAVKQVGDATAASDTDPQQRDSLRRAQMACLEGRGYTVK